MKQTKINPKKKNNSTKETKIKLINISTRLENKINTKKIRNIN